jgi:hypothetical protein
MLTFKWVIGALRLPGLVLASALLGNLSGPIQARADTPSAPDPSSTIVVSAGNAGVGLTERYACVGGQTSGQMSPLTVVLIVGGDGAVSKSRAIWIPPRSSGDHDSFIILRYALLGRDVGGKPFDLQVLAGASMTPPPSADAADIVLSLNGVEKARRPWSLYAQQIADFRSSPKHQASLLGIIPFSPSPDDRGLNELLAAVGRPGTVIEVRVMGDDGSILQTGSFAVESPAVNTKARIDAALDEALTKAKAPTSCQKLSS